MADIYDDLCERILRAQEEMLKHEVEANTVVLNGKKYGKLMKPGCRQTIFGMALEVDRMLPDDCDFIVQYREPKLATNADRIRAMTDEELAEFQANIGYCPPIHNRGYHCKRHKHESCSACWLDWLKQEASDVQSDISE